MSKRILLTDDSEFYMQSIKLILENGGYSVVTAVNGQEALNTLRNPDYQGTGGFDLIISDVDMPVLDGYGLVKQLKVDPELSIIPIILLTYLSDMENIDRAVEIGVDDYFIKSDQTLEKIIEMVRKKIG